MISVIVTFLFHSFFNSVAKDRYLSFFSLSFAFILSLAGTILQVIIIIIIIIIIIYSFRVFHIGVS